jgi:hypothetical protein
VFLRLGLMFSGFLGLCVRVCRFNMPAPTITPEVKRDLQLLKVCASAPERI